MIQVLNLIKQMKKEQDDERSSPGHRMTRILEDSSTGNQEVEHRPQSARLMDLGSSFIFISPSRGRRVIPVVVIGFEGGEGIRAFDNPSESEKRETGQYSGAPCVRVPLAVLSYSEPPLISESCCVWVHRFRRIGIVGPVGVASSSSGGDFREFRRRRASLGGVGFRDLRVAHRLCSPVSDK